MNVQSIWVGEHYAFFDYRPNNKFVMNAMKGRALKTEKVQEHGNSRKTAYVLFEIERADGVTYEQRVRARDVIDFWDSYENERDALLKEREEEERQRREERERWHREREERIRQEQQERQERERVANEKREVLIDALVSKTGLPRAAVYSVGPGNINLDRSIVEVWLSVNV